MGTIGSVSRRDFFFPGARRPANIVYYVRMEPENPVVSAAANAFARAREAEPSLTAMMNFRGEAAERELFDAVAEHLGMSRSAFMRGACVDVALAVVEQAGGPGAVEDAARQRGETRMARAAAAVAALAARNPS